MTKYTFDPRCMDSVDWSHIYRLSNDPVKKVGAVLAMGNGKEYFGANHVPWTHNLANMEWVWKLNRDVGRGLVIHAEAHAILRAIEQGETNFLGSTLIVSLEPCFRCKSLIEACGISEVYYGTRIE